MDQEDIIQTEHDMESALEELIAALSFTDPDSDVGELEDSAEAFRGCSVRTFRQAMIMSSNRGIVVEMPSGTRFQISIVEA